MCANTANKQCTYTTYGQTLRWCQGRFLDKTKIGAHLQKVSILSAAGVLGSNPYHALALSLGWALHSGHLLSRAEPSFPLDPTQPPSTALSFLSVLVGKLRLPSRPRAREGCHGQGARVAARELKPSGGRGDAGAGRKWGPGPSLQRHPHEPSLGQQPALLINLST